MKKLNLPAYCGLVAALLFSCAIFFNCTAESEKSDTVVSDVAKTTGTTGTNNLPVIQEEKEGNQIPGTQEGISEEKPENGNSETVNMLPVVPPEEKPILEKLEGLSAETEKQIIQDYWEIYSNADPVTKQRVEAGLTTIDVIRIARYYGTYNGYSVVIFSWAMTAAIWQEDIGGVIFEESSAPSGLGLSGFIAAWKDGKFYNIADLYEENLLTKDDLLQIQKRQVELRGMR